MSDSIQESVTGSQDWGSFLRQASEPEAATEQPEVDSETVETTDEQPELPDSDGVEVDEDQPETESETETPSFNDDSEIDMGEDRKSVKLSELKEGYMRQSDYTKKTQELASLRKEVESQKESLKNTQGWLDYMDNNPWLFQQIDAAIKEFNETGVLPIQEALQDAQYGKYINHLGAENARLTKELESLKGENEGFKLTSTMSGLKSELQKEYGELVTDEYMQTLQTRAKAEKLSQDTLKEIADGYLAKQKLKAQPDTKKVSKEAEAKAIQKLQETKRVAPQAPKPTSHAPVPPSAPEKEDWGSFFRRLSK